MRSMPSLGGGFGGGVGAAAETGVVVEAVAGILGS